MSYLQEKQRIRLFITDGDGSIDLTCELYGVSPTWAIDEPADEIWRANIVQVHDYAIETGRTKIPIIWALAHRVNTTLNLYLKENKWYAKAAGASEIMEARIIGVN